MWSIKDKRFLTFREMFAEGIDQWHTTAEYERAGIEVIENSSEEILALTQEMNARIDQTWVPHSEDEELQKRYKSFYPPEHYSYGFPSRIGAEFLRQNQELLRVPQTV